MGDVLEPEYYDTGIYSVYHCQECGAPLIEAQKKYSACPNGHGKLKNKLPLKVKRRNHAMYALGLKDAKLDTDGSYLVEGTRIPMKKVGTINRIVNGWNDVFHKEGQRLALDGTTILVLEPVDD